ncbi:MAG TPA: hypothetical protein VEY51_04395 [Chondromyces sp.]|nr:hypothetical protein [Chondromyces sp.]
MIRMFLLLCGFGLAVIGGAACIIYLNLLAAGMTLHEYFSYISKKVECYFLPAGFMIITASIYLPGISKD